MTLLPASQTWHDPSDVTRWIGVLIALTGAFVVSPEGTAMLISSGLAWGRQRIRELRRALGRVIPFLKPDDSLTSVTSSVSTSWAVGEPMVFSSIPWLADVSIADKVELLHRQIEQIYELTKSVHGRLSEDIGHLEGRLVALEGKLRAEVQTLRASIAGIQIDAARTDARALPIVGLGVALSGIPDELARLPLLVLVAIWIGALGITVKAAADAAADRRQNRQLAAAGRG